jgi:hypothetical protein
MRRALCAHAAEKVSKDESNLEKAMEIQRLDNRKARGLRPGYVRDARDEHTHVPPTRSSNLRPNGWLAMIRMEKETMGEAAL